MLQYLDGYKWSVEVLHIHDEKKRDLSIYRDLVDVK